MIKAENYKIFSEIYCPIVPAPLELYFSDGYRSVMRLLRFACKVKQDETMVKIKWYNSTCKSCTNDSKKYTNPLLIGLPPEEALSAGSHKNHAKLKIHSTSSITDFDEIYFI